MNYGQDFCQLMMMYNKYFRKYHILIIKTIERHFFKASDSAYCSYQNLLASEDMPLHILCLHSHYSSTRINSRE